ncbi:MAG: sugar transferase [Firmicutes bacterium]|nr:sugar transferase [Bacillota bacterium]
MPTAAATPERLEQLEQPQAEQTRQSESAVSGGAVYRVIKRTADIFFSLAVLVLLSPVLLLIGLAVVLDDPHAGPIYRQKRCGKGGKEFSIYKFRSMRKDADKHLAELMERNEMTGPAFKIHDDPRITRVGKLLRRTCLDELPQFVNVLLGQMSVVGPRPPLPAEVAEYTPEQRLRLAVKPGITCIWQTTPGKNDLSFDEWVALDVQYIQTRSLWLDLKLIFKTVGVMLRVTNE